MLRLHHPFHRWQKGKRKNGDEVTEVGKILKRK